MTQGRIDDARGNRSSTGVFSRRKFATTLSAALAATTVGVGLSRTSVGATARLDPQPALVPQSTPVATPGPDTSASPRLLVAPTAVRFDERFDVAVAGLQPRQEVTISSAFKDAMLTDWSAEASFAADAYGVVNPSAQRPINGTFDVPDTMGLIWSAQASDTGYYAPLLTGAETVTITATTNEAEIGQATVERTILPAGNRSTYINEDDMVANFFEPVSGSPTPAPAVIVLGGSDGGLNPYTDLTAALLASRGYAALSLAYFGLEHLPLNLEAIPLEYFGDAIAWLQRQPSVDADRLGVIGVSRGGELALLLGSIYQELTAVVSYVGSGFVHPSPYAMPPAPAWTWQDEPLPFLDWTRQKGPEELRQVEIPVEQINGPVLLISGDDDALWPSTAYSSVAWDRLKRNEHPWPDQFLRYPGAGHGISAAPYLPVGPLVSPEIGGDPHSNVTAMANAWPAVCHLLESRLKY